VGHQLPAECRGEILVSRSAAKQEHAKELGAKAKEFFKRSPRCHQMWLIDSSTLLSRFRKSTQHLMWHQVSLLVQLRAGHMPLQKHLHRIGKADMAQCPACVTTDETVIHFMLLFLAYRAQRSQLEREIHRAAGSMCPLTCHFCLQH